MSIPSSNFLHTKKDLFLQGLTVDTHDTSERKEQQAVTKIDPTYNLRLENISFRTSPPTCEKAKSPATTHRNRYPDVLAADLDIVELPVPYDGNSYINANRFHNMIITQGPILKPERKINTLTDFWAMVFENNTSDIVCLTNQINDKLHEQTVAYWNPKLHEQAYIALDCLDYTEINTKTVFDKFIKRANEDISLRVQLVANEVVHFQDKEDDQAVTERIFEITLGDTKKSVHHWHYENWPDHSVCNPKKLAKLLQQTLKQTESISVVHCSAGRGRASVYAVAKQCIENEVKIGIKTTEEIIDQQISSLRQRRPDAVETARQLKLITDTIQAWRDLFQ